MSIESIQQPVIPFLNAFSQEFNEVLRSKSQWLNTAIKHIYDNSGKQLRPLFTGLIAGMLADDHTIPATTVKAAVVLELIHTATLIHDDVIDNSNQRRGNPTLNALYYNNVAVLIGDFVLTSAIGKALEMGELAVIGIVTEAGKKLTEGEIKQYETAENTVIDESVYLEVIHEKTARLFMACADLAALTVKAKDEDAARAQRIGELLGYAFQIKDDIFDYFDNNVGKPTGKDIKEGKVTLPLLYAIQQAKPEKKEQLLTLLAKKKYNEEEIAFILNFAKSHGGIEYAEQKMDAFMHEARQLILQFPSSAYQKALLELTDYIGQRTK